MIVPRDSCPWSLCRSPSSQSHPSAEGPVDFSLFLSCSFCQSCPLTTLFFVIFENVCVVYLYTIGRFLIHTYGIICYKLFFLFFLFADILVTSCLYVYSLHTHYLQQLIVFYGIDVPSTATLYQQVLGPWHLHLYFCVYYFLLCYQCIITLKYQA